MILKLAEVKPPVAKKNPQRLTYNGQAYTDDYFWLRDEKNPETIPYLKAENVYTETLTAHTKEGQERLFKEMVGRIQETDTDVPVKLDNYWYYSRTLEGLEYEVHCRRKDSETGPRPEPVEGPEKVILNENELAAAFDFFELGEFEISPSHNLLAYSVDTRGDEIYTLFVKDLRTDQLLGDQIENVSAVEWANDNLTLFYTTLDEAHRPYRLYRHALGTPVQNDTLLYEEKDEAFNLDIMRTKSNAYLLMNSISKTTCETRYLDANKPYGDFKIMQARQKSLEYYVDHHGDYFYVLTNDNALNFKLMRTPVDQPGRAHWEEVIAHRPNVKLDELESFRDFLVVHERADGVPQMRVLNLKDNGSYYVEFPEPVYAIWSAENPDFNSDLVRFTYTSLVTPKTVFDFNMLTKERTARKEYTVRGGYDRTQFVSERILATAPDGTRIPISLVYKKGLVRDGRNPTYLTGYGAYGDVSDPYFSSNRLSLLERGFIYAIAHIRGGGEMGRQWYEDGKLMHKKNTFTDFIACAEHLIAQKYTSTDRLAISGGSAGGLLIGAVVNMRPDLFKVAVADVPFVDVINTMMDPNLPLTVTEYDEWGNPNEAAAFAYMKSYAPYENMKAQNYPIMLVTAGLNDPRVGYWEAAKYVARLRTLKTDQNPLILRTNMAAGHGGASGRYEFLHEIAFEFAFILDQLGIAF